MSKKNIEHIAFICDDAYALPTMVCIEAIKKYADKNDYIIHICSFKLNAENEKNFSKLSNSKVRVEINYFDENYFIERLEKIEQRTHVTTTALIKFELPLFFNRIERLLYIDSDVIVNKNFEDIFNFKIDNYYLAASFEFYKFLNNLYYVPKHKRDNSFYFNSGVMLMNLKRMRENNITEKLWHYKLYEAKTKLMDQESFNEVCKKNVMQLSIVYNFNPEFSSNTFLNNINEVYNLNYIDFKYLINDIRFIHYVGKYDKPWNYKDARMREYWDDLYNRLSISSKELKFKTRNDKKGTLNIISDIIKNHGLTGFFCYTIFKFRNKG